MNRNHVHTCDISYFSLFFFKSHSELAIWNFRLFCQMSELPFSHSALSNVITCMQASLYIQQVSRSVLQC